ncbi:MAG: SDR family oxidoreductase [Planctomycetaceae bacterium]
MTEASQRMPLNVSDVAIVTGAAKRLGRDISLALANDPGLNIVVHYHRSQEAAEHVVGDIQSVGRRAVCVSADLNQPDTATSTIFAAAATLGPVRVLVNCAAVFEDRDLVDVDVQHWSAHFTVNALAPLLLTQQFAAQLPHGVTGHVVNILDWRATRPPASHAVYSASKAALASITRCLAQQLAPQIQVNAIAPGAILPPPGRDHWHMQRAATAIPLQRPGQSADVSNAVVFLVKSGFITGEILHVSGGEQL